MNYSLKTDQGEAVLRVEGELDALTVTQLREVLDSLVAEGDDGVRVDLSRLRLIDSSGVGALVSLYKRLRARGRPLRVEGLREQPLAIFRILQLDQVLTDGSGAGATGN
jgi:anti-sigma B factor antagonist